ncbi:MAG TPA: pitrilysin family protein [Myxococcales bacterium]|nr:pitrilysin family protein [Myxococcales bacterium]
MKDVALPPLLVEPGPDGLTVAAIQKRGVPLFHVRLSLPAGAACDPRGKAGLAQFTADLLRRGTQRRDAHGVDAMIEGMGAQLSVDVSLDECALGLTVPAELSAAAVDALLEVALLPSFPEAEVTQTRRRALAALQADLDDPGTVAARAAIAVGYGEDHPYGHPASGFRRDVETFTREDAAAFHADRFRKRGALLSVAGRDDPAQLLRFAQDRLSAQGQAWPRAAAKDLPLPGPAAHHAQMRAIVVHKPDATQAQVRIVSPGISRQDPRWAAAVVANTALGGGFTSVLVDAIRVDRGLSYSVSSRLAMGRHAGLSVFSSFTKNETLRELVDLALEKMRAYRGTGPGPDALAKTRTYLAGLFPFGLEAHESIAENVSDCILDGLGLSHLATYRSRIASVSEDAAREAAFALSPGREGAQIVVVGDAEVARKALAGLCPIEIRPLE